jgi:hypothetical protein
MPAAFEGNWPSARSDNSFDVDGTEWTPAPPAPGLEIEQIAFDLETFGETRQGTGSTYYTMTGGDDCDRAAPVRGADCAHGG